MLESRCLTYLTIASMRNSMLVMPRCSDGCSVRESRIFFMMKITFSMNWVCVSATTTCAGISRWLSHQTGHYKTYFKPRQKSSNPKNISTQTCPEESKNLSTLILIWSKSIGNSAALSSWPTSSLTCFCICGPNFSLLQTSSFNRLPRNLKTDFALP